MKDAHRMADLLADFETHRGVPGQRLRVDVVLKELDRDDPDRAKALRTVLGDPDKYEGRLISRTVTKEWGIRLSQSAVHNWRDRNGLFNEGRNESVDE